MPDRWYAGYTINLEQRLVTHNSGGSVYTANHRPWKLTVVLQFEQESKAKEFEQFLKTASGRAFIKKRFL